MTWHGWQEHIERCLSLLQFERFSCFIFALLRLSSTALLHRLSDFRQTASFPDRATPFCPASLALIMQDASHKKLLANQMDFMPELNQSSYPVPGLEDSAEIGEFLLTMLSVRSAAFILEMTFSLLVWNRDRASKSTLLQHPNRRSTFGSTKPEWYSRRHPFHGKWPLSLPFSQGNNNSPHLTAAIYFPTFENHLREDTEVNQFASLSRRIPLANNNNSPGKLSPVIG